MNRQRRKLRPMLLVIALIGPPSLALAQDQPSGEFCGDVFTNAIGPFDYLNPDDRTRTKTAGVPVVENYHFTPDVEGFRLTPNRLMGDLGYTLRAVPNHHRALNAIARYDIERGIPPNERSAQCWFDRALRFRPEDGTVWQVYGNWLSRKNRAEDAIKAYTRAKEINPDSAEVHYNIGLLYLRMGQLEKARESARLAYEGNYPLPGLRRKLAEKGYPLD